MISFLRYIDYYNQEPFPQALKTGEVQVDLLNEIDSQSWKEIPRRPDENFRMFQLKFKGEFHTYTTLTKIGQILWTLNEKGEPKAPSVFKIKEQEIF